MSGAEKAAAMPRYRFNIHDSSGLVEDEEGLELPDTEAARAKAIAGARSLVAGDVLEGRLDLGGRIEVLDADGRLLFSISFAEAAGGPQS